MARGIALHGDMPSRSSLSRSDLDLSIYLCVCVWLSSLLCLTLTLPEHNRVEPHCRCRTHKLSARSRVAHQRLGTLARGLPGPRPLGEQTHAPRRIRTRLLTSVCFSVQVENHRFVVKHIGSRKKVEARYILMSHSIVRHHTPV